MNEQERIEIEKLARGLCKFWKIQEEDIEDYIQEAYLVALEYEEKRDEVIKKALAKKRGKEKTRREKEMLSKNLY